MKRRIILINLMLLASLNCTAQDKDGNEATKITPYNATIIWVKNLKDSSFTSLFNSGNKIFAVTRKGTVNCFDPEGKLLWKKNIKREIVSRPLYYEGSLIIAATNGDLISMDDSTGNIQQSIGLDEPLTSHLISIPAENNGQSTEAAIAGTSKGSIYCYDISTFEMLWENHSATGAIRSKPLSIMNKVIYTSDDGHLYCIDSRSGMLIWKWSPPNKSETKFGNSAPVSDGKSVFICLPDKSVYSIDLMLGQTNWKNSYTNCYSSIGLSSNKQLLIIKSQKDDIFFINSRTGRIERRYDASFGKDTTSGDFLFTGKNILFGTESGKIYSIDKGIKVIPLLNMGDDAIYNIISLGNNKFAASNDIGDIVLFTEH